MAQEQHQPCRAAGQPRGTVAGADSRAEIEAKLLSEAERVVSSLEAALAAAPEDEELRAQLQLIVEQARRLRGRVEQAIAEARRKRASEA